MRQGNIELLRIISIILIVVLHADLFSLSAPDYNRLMISPLVSISQLAVESIAICLVNIFIFISGWFGVRPTIKSFSNLCFQILYFTIGIYFTTILLGVNTINLSGILSIVFLTNNGWFIRSYILLLILAPIINLYITNTNRLHFKWLLIFFFLFQTIYGWLFDVAKFFDNGYSTISFVGIYLLARYMKIFNPKVSNFNRYYDLLIFIFLSVTLTILTIYPAYLSNSYRIMQLFAYNNPIVILMSLFLFLFFTKLKFYNQFIIKLASSSFAIYLLHCNPNIMNEYFVRPIKYFYQNFDGVESLGFITLIVIIYIVAALILDIPRKYIWNKYLLPKFK